MATAVSTAGKSFSADVLYRILSILHRDGPAKKTNLAGKTRLNYLTCVKYLDLLKSLGLVKVAVDSENEGERYSISDAGLSFSTSLFTYLQKMSRTYSTESNSFDDEKNLVDLVQSESENRTVNKVQLSNPEKIMLVDDEKDILFTYKLFLAEGGYNVDVFTDPSEALRQIAVSPSTYQLVITDIRMSSINGLQLYHGIRSLNQDIKIIFLSALDAAEELVSILPGLNKQLVLRKPVNKEVFAKAVALALR